MLDHEYKEVRYDKYCAKCKNSNIAGYEEPCNECLDNPMNLYSQKPIKFEEKENKGSRKKQSL